MSKKDKDEPINLIRKAAAKDRERTLLQDRVNRAHADELRRTEKALDWQRDPGAVAARRTGGALRILYYTALVILTPLSAGLILIFHYGCKKIIETENSMNFVYYAFLIFLLVPTFGLILIPHFIMKKMIADRRAA